MGEEKPEGFSVVSLEQGEETRDETATTL